MDAGLTAQLEAMAHGLGQIDEARAELKDLRRLIEVLTGMVEGLVANQRASGDEPEQELTSEAPPASAKAEETGAADDHPARELAESSPSILEAGISAEIT